jgi:hypothetical protein
MSTNHRVPTRAIQDTAKGFDALRIHWQAAHPFITSPYPTHDDTSRAGAEMPTRFGLPGSPVRFGPELTSRRSTTVGTTEVPRARWTARTCWTGLQPHANHNFLHFFCRQNC